MNNDGIDDDIQRSGSETAEPAASKWMTPRRWIALAVAMALTLFQIVSTEFRVAELTAEGFGDVVITSTRNHAYFPLIGGLVGALAFIGVGKAIKRLLGS